ncbi:putative E3 ubiquitin-protein ligase MARCH8 isoform X3 [Apostichopus japonicus]|uniref:Putative E3 ubiquitin-protein ligase MARCH8 isoform X3 n=1 Tax=Stichopus japonicus TaxID=307972 RepID=A0A2G8JWY4_STIJA|nr:putative E3 ubiquitin-protein ligase MARCH8 isoform X3 [Apostichopus japonicus]
MPRANATSAASVTLQEVREFPLNNRQTAVETVVKSIEDPACRICQETRNRKGKNRLVAPCGCKGSTKYVHRKCLQKWCAMKKTAECEICHHPYHPQFLKAPGLSKSDENSIVSSTMVFCLLLGVFGVSLYLLFAHLSTVESIFKGVLGYTFYVVGFLWILSIPLLVCSKLESNIDEKILYTGRPRFAEVIPFH